MIFSQTPYCYDKIKKTSLETKETEYNGKREVLSLEKDVVENLDEYKCPINCILKNKSCLTDFDGTIVSLTGSIVSFARTDIPGGQISDVCVFCKNNAESIQSEIKLLQKPRSKCFTSLSKNKAGVNQISFGKTTQTKIEVQEFFKNSEQKNCPITSCRLQDQNCQGEYQGGRIQMVLNGSEATFTKIKEFKETEIICLKCSNGMQEATKGEILVLAKAYFEFPRIFKYLMNDVLLVKYKTNTKIEEVKKMNFEDEIIAEVNQNENQVKLTFIKEGNNLVKFQFKDFQGNEFPIESRFYITDDQSQSEKSTKVRENDEKTFKNTTQEIINTQELKKSESVDSVQIEVQAKKTNEDNSNLEEPLKSSESTYEESQNQGQIDQKPLPVDLDPYEAALNKITLEAFRSTESMSDEELANECFIQSCEQNQLQSEDEDEDENEDIEEVEEKVLKLFENQINSEAKEKYMAEILTNQKNLKQSIEESKEAVIMRKKKVKQAERKETNIRLRSIELLRTRVGYVFPGSDLKVIERASKLYEFSKQNESLQSPEEPQIRIFPLTPDGGAVIRFSEPMIAPKKETKLSTKLYQKVFGISVEAKSDNSIFKGDFQSQTRGRMFETDETEGDASKMTFTPQIINHNETFIALNLEFQNLEKMSIGGVAEVTIEIKEPSVFKCVQTLKALEKNSFVKGELKLVGDLPPLIDDIGTAEQIENNTGTVEKITKYLIPSNFLFNLIMIGVMQHLFSLIRSLQLVNLSSTITVRTPIHMHIYLGILVQFAQMDILDGKSLYEMFFKFLETAPPSPQFAFFGLDNSNFILNSGSYFIVQFILIGYYLLMYVIQKVCQLFPTVIQARKLGILTFKKSYLNEFGVATFKLLLENYFGLVFCTVLNNFTFFYKNREFSLYFATRDDALCSTMTIIYNVVVLLFPFICYQIVSHYQGKFNKENKILSILLEEVNPDSFHASMYTIYFLLRRLATGIILISMTLWPFFQSTFLMVFSAINWIYLGSVKPLKTEKLNNFEFFNEICIYICAHLHTVLCRSEGGSTFINRIGWSSMGVGAINILVNISNMLYESIQGTYETYWQKKHKKAIEDKKREQEQLPRTQLEQNIHDFLEMIKFSEEWSSHHKWLKAIKVDFKDYENEVKFRDICYELKHYILTNKIQRDKECVKRYNQLLLQYSAEIENNFSLTYNDKLSYASLFCLAINSRYEEFLSCVVNIYQRVKAIFTQTDEEEIFENMEEMNPIREIQDLEMQSISQSEDEQIEQVENETQTQTEQALKQDNDMQTSMKSEEWKKQVYKQKADEIKTLNKEGTRKKQSVDRRHIHSANSKLRNSKSNVGLDVVSEVGSSKHSSNSSESSGSSQRSSEEEIKELDHEEESKIENLINAKQVRNPVTSIISQPAPEIDIENQKDQILHMNVQEFVYSKSELINAKVEQNMNEFLLSVFEQNNIEQNDEQTPENQFDSYFTQNELIMFNINAKKDLEQMLANKLPID